MSCKPRKGQKVKPKTYYIFKPISKDYSAAQLHFPLIKKQQRGTRAKDFTSFCAVFQNQDKIK